MMFSEPIVVWSAHFHLRQFVALRYLILPPIILSDQFNGESDARSNARHNKKFEMPSHAMRERANKVVKFQFPVRLILN